MRRILYIEWLKVRKYRAFIVLAVLSAVSILGISYIVHSVNSSIREATGPNQIADVMLGKPFDFPGVWHTVAYIGSFMHLLPALLMIMLVCNEYNFRTNRQNVIDGLSRSGFMWGKIVLAAGLSLMMSLMVLVTACVFGLQGGTGFSFVGIEYVGLYFVQSLAHVGFAMVLATLFKKAGLAVGMYILYAFIVENILGAVLTYGFESPLGAFLPLDSADKLIGFPSTMAALVPTVVERPATGWLLATATGWIVLEMWFCRWMFCRKDM